MPEGQKIGYVTIDFKDNEYRGAVLIVDFRGIPLDFRYTDPVSPTKLEKVLYGGSLDVYIREEVILESLIKATEERPGLWICRERFLLNSIKEKINVPVVLLESTSRKSLEGPGQFQALAEDKNYLVQVDLMGPPYRVELASDDDIDSIASMLSVAASTMEITEPFDRIVRAFGAIE